MPGPEKLHLVPILVVLVGVAGGEESSVATEEENSGSLSLEVELDATKGLGSMEGKGETPLVTAVLSCGGGIRIA
jgi:hypothetical protein